MIASGCGIGLALMDVLPVCRFFLDVDRYRNSPVDWEIIAAVLSMGDNARMILAGWFSFDGSQSFDSLQRGFKGDLYRYDGGGGSSLSDFINSCDFFSVREF